MNPTTMLNRFWKPIAGVLGLAMVILYSSGSCRGKVRPGTLAYEAGISLPAVAETFTAKLEKRAPRIDVIGTIGSEEQIHLSARIPAYVKEVFVSAGSAVKKGETMLTLDDREIAEQMAAAEAQFKQAETEYQRAKQLLESKATTDQAFIAAESSYNGAKAQMERVRVMMSYARITSPIDGIVIDRRIEVGDLANPGQVLLTVYDSGHMRLEAPVPVRLVDRLALNQDVEVKLDRPDKTFQGRVSQIVSEIDPMSRTQLVKIRLDGVTGDVLPGTFGRFFVDDTARETLLVPASAVYRSGQLEMIQVVEGDRVVRRLVKSGSVSGDKIEILSGLKDGEKVLVKPVTEG
jgi:membrane fusion protein, multidrug efflux system